MDFTTTRGFALVVALCCPLFAPTARCAPVVSEFMAANNSALYDEDGDSSDWIELFNPDGAAIDIGGSYLTNDAGDRTKWEFPSPTVLPSGGVLIVFASVHI